MDALTSRESRVESLESEEARAAAAGNGGSEQASRSGDKNELTETVGDAEDLVGEDAKLGAVQLECRRVPQAIRRTRRVPMSRQTPPFRRPFLRSKVIEVTDLTKVFAFINETALFKGQWQYTGKKDTRGISAILEETVYPNLPRSRPRRYVKNC